MDIDHSHPQIPKILVHHRNGLVWENNHSMDKWDRMVEVKGCQVLDHKATEC